MKDLTRCRPTSADSESARADAARCRVASTAQQPGHLGPASPAGRLPRYLGNLGVQQVVATSGVTQLWRCGPHSCDCSPEQRAAAGEPRVSHPGDPAEQEADRVAEAVLRTPDPALPHTEQPGPPTISRWATTREPGGQPGSGPGPGLGAAIGEACRTAGEPIADPTRRFMEARFGRDLGAVRVHIDPAAAELAQRVDARAFTTGDHVFFAAGRYRPDTPDGRLLMAHELVHVAQQGSAGVAGGATGAPRQLARQPAAPAPAPAKPAPAPAYGKACGTPDPCLPARCTGDQPATIAGDLTRAMGYVDAAIQALRASPLGDATVRALDWYFADHGPTTAATARARLECIRWSLNDTQSHSRWGCHPDDPNLAYVCTPSIDICAHYVTPVCLTSKYFGNGARGRAETLIHECAHREGMSVDAERGRPDVYHWEARFRNLTTAQALTNSDSFAGFTTGATDGIPLSNVMVLGASGGLATAGAGRTTWFARLYLGAELQHPRLSLFNPTLGLGMTVIGAPDFGRAAPGTPSPLPLPSLLYSVLPGVRIAPPRPGGAGSLQASIFGGPALVIGSSTALGAEAGVAVGYRWRWLDVSTGVGYVYDPTRRERGGENLLTVGATISFTPLTL